VREEEVCAFVQRSIGSVWALELLLLLWRGRDRTWRADELVRELRSSDTVVREALAQLTSAGLAQQTGEGWRYGGATSEPDQAVAELEKLYAAKPSMIVRLVLSTPSERLRVFSNAFKFKDSTWRRGGLWFTD
jgi:predicted DNA-binding transcriptional regulator